MRNNNVLRSLDNVSEKLKELRSSYNTFQNEGRDILSTIENEINIKKRKVMRNDSTKRRYGSIPEIFGLRDWYVRNFDDAFETHDYNYDVALMTRRQADKTLLRDMKNLIKSTHKSKRKRFGYYITAYAAYLMVRLFGWSSYGGDL